MLNNKGERELAYVVKVSKIEAIPKADNIELAHVLGWSCIVKKGEFKEGDLGIYFEIDSHLPSNNPAFEFMAAKKYKVKTMRLSKFNVISQGLLLPASAFNWELGTSGQFAGDVPIIVTHDTIYPYFCEGEFLTQYLNVTHIDETTEEEQKKERNPEAEFKKIKGQHPKLFKNAIIKWLSQYKWVQAILIALLRQKDNPNKFPTHLPFVTKTDEERIAANPALLLDRSVYRKTTKIDGTSATFILERLKWGKTKFYVCSRNVNLTTPQQPTYIEQINKADVSTQNVYYEAAEKYHIKEFLESCLQKYPTWSYVALQGEIAGVSSTGMKIQGNRHGFTSLQFFGFNLIDSVKGRWDSVLASDFVKPYGIQWVPIVDENYILPLDLEEFMKSADGVCEAPGAAPGTLREGYVYRKKDDPNVSFKNVSRAYLLKNHL